uniref:Ribosomal_L7Ae domain-containing protein n=1 Tax=Panagrellus redivivus TaxID=6233 RepID=A0A7E4UNQ4_PANRE
MMTLDSFWSTILAQCCGFIWFLACLTVSIYGGNEPGKPLPDTYTFEQYQEYKRIHGAEATRKKVRELEARRAEKEKLDRRRVKTHTNNAVMKRPAGSGPGKTLGKPSTEKNADISGKSGSKEVKTMKEVTTCREKSKVNPLAVLDNLGFSKKTHKKKKKDRKKTEKSYDPLADGFTKRRTSKKKVDEPVSDGDISDERKLNKHKKIHSSAERCDAPLTPLDMSFSKDSKSTTNASTTSSDTPNNPNRLRAKWNNKANNRDAAASPLTAREKTKKEKGMGAFPMPTNAPAISPKNPKEDDDFSPTVFEAVNAPVRPFIEKSTKPKKKKKGSKRQRTIDDTNLSAIRVNIPKPTKAQSPDVNDLAVDMEEPQQVSVEVKLQRIKAKLRRTHTQTVLQLEKQKKKRKSGKIQSGVKQKQPTPLIALGGPVPANIQIRQPVTLKKKQKKKRTVKKVSDTSGTQSKTDTDEKKGAKPADVEEKSDAFASEASVAEKKTCISVNDDNTVETVDLDNKTEKSFDECDTEEDDSETIEMFRLAKLDMRRTKSARAYKEPPPEKLKCTASARIFGRPTPNVRLPVAVAAAIEKAKQAKKVLTPSTSPSCTSSSNCSTPPTASTSTTWSNVTVTSTPPKKVSH